MHLDFDFTEIFDPGVLVQAHSFSVRKLQQKQVTNALRIDGKIENKFGFLDLFIIRVFFCLDVKESLCNAAVIAENPLVYTARRLQLFCSKSSTLHIFHFPIYHA